MRIVLSGAKPRCSPTLYTASFPGVRGLGLEISMNNEVTKLSGVAFRCQPFSVVILCHDINGFIGFVPAVLPLSARAKGGTINNKNRQ